MLSRSLGGKFTGKHVLVKGFPTHLLLVPHFCAKQCVAFEHQGAWPGPYRTELIYIYIYIYIYTYIYIYIYIYIYFYIHIYLSM